MGLSLPALAYTVVIDFDSIANSAHVNQFYNGGIDSLGGSGTNFGIDFSAFVTATSLSAPNSPPRYVYVAGATGMINVAAGFTSFRFAHGTLAPATLSVFSGLNGTGTLLGSQLVNRSSTACAEHGVVRGRGQVGIPVLAAQLCRRGRPALRDGAAGSRAGSWAMMLAGFGVLGMLTRRRTR